MRPKRSRQPDTHGRDPPVAALRSCGLTFRLAGRVIGEVVDIWKRALTAGDFIKLPVGRLLVRKQRIVLRPARGGSNPGVAVFTRDIDAQTTKKIGTSPARDAAAFG